MRENHYAILVFTYEISQVSKLQDEHNASSFSNMSSDRFSQSVCKNSKKTRHNILFLRKPSMLDLIEGTIQSIRQKHLPLSLCNLRIYFSERGMMSLLYFMNLPSDAVRRHHPSGFSSMSPSLLPPPLPPDTMPFAFL